MSESVTPPPDEGADDISLEAAIARTAAHGPAGHALVVDAGASAEMCAARVPRAIMAACGGLALGRVEYDARIVYDEIASPALRARYHLTDDDLRAARGLLSEALAPAVLESFSPEWVERLRPRARKRAAMRVYEGMVKDLESAPDADVESVIAASTTRLLRLGEEQEREDPDPYAQFRRWARSGTYGIAVGFRFYDAHPKLMGLGGAVRGKLYTATAPSNEGKSTFAVSLVANIARLKSSAEWWLRAREQGTEVELDLHMSRLAERAREYNLSLDEVMERQAKVQILYISTENDPGELGAMVVSNLTGFSTDEVVALDRDDAPPSDNREIVRDWFGFIRGFCYFYGRVTVASEVAALMGQVARKAESEGATTIALVDHMHRMSGLRKESDAGSVKGNINVWYKAMFELVHDTARAYSIHALCFAQMDEAQRSEFRATNDLATLKFKESGDIFNVVDAAFVFGKSRTKQMASIGWIKKVRALSNAMIYDRPWLMAVRPVVSEMREIARDEYDGLPERVIEGR